MQRPEQEHNSETAPRQQWLAETNETIITVADLNTLYTKRTAELQRLEKSISPKLFSDIQEKITREKARFLRRLAAEDARREALARYSFFLNPHFFEQKFFGE